MWTYTARASPYEVGLIQQGKICLIMPLNVLYCGIYYHFERTHTEVFKLSFQGIFTDNCFSRSKPVTASVVPPLYSKDSKQNQEICRVFI